MTRQIFQAWESFFIKFLYLEKSRNKSVQSLVKTIFRRTLVFVESCVIDFVPDTLFQMFSTHGTSSQVAVEIFSNLEGVEPGFFGFNRDDSTRLCIGCLVF